MIQRTPFLFASLALASLAACGGGGGSDAPADTSNQATQAVEIQFAAVAGSQRIACGDTINGLGTNGVSAQLRDLRFYVSNAALVRADGSEVPVTLATNAPWNLTVGNDRVTLIDLENASGACPSSTGTSATNAVLQGNVPAGSYTG